ncbi:MAG: hypothetical protein ACLTKR_09885 [Clostridium sp.]|uniref:hypothetical protein n=1 Tax=Clostridium sp. TaxID=1506 RepID=UPI0039918FB7
MKKKLLSLVLAGAMVASTSVSAFAQNKNIQNVDTEEPTTEVTITGQVLGENGEKPAANFNVTVPTSAAFTVSKTSSVLSVPIEIQNNGTQDIDVYADKFVDATTADGQGITVVKESEVKSHDRTYVSLRLQGDINTAYLKTETDTSTKSGIYKKATLDDADIVGTDGLKLTNVQKSQTKSLNLVGTVGDTGTAVTNAVSNDFTLTLRIKKSSK